MNKIREEFSKVSKLFNYWMTTEFTEDEHVFDIMEGDTNAIPFWAGYKSRDEEVRDLQEQIGYLKGDIINLKGRLKEDNNV